MLLWNPELFRYKRYFELSHAKQDFMLSTTKSALNRPVLWNLLERVWQSPFRGLWWLELSNRMAWPQLEIELYVMLTVWSRYQASMLENRNRLFKISRHCFCPIEIADGLHKPITKTWSIHTVKLVYCLAPCSRFSAGKTSNRCLVNDKIIWPAWFSARHQSDTLFTTWCKTLGIMTLCVYLRSFRLACNQCNLIPQKWRLIE